jgi:hypothetical protein
MTLTKATVTRSMRMTMTTEAGLLDDYCRWVIAGNPNKLVAWWIMAAWAYEHGERPLISDALFDEIVADLDFQWACIEHRHKDLLDRSVLKSAIAIGGKWPLIAQNAAQSLLRNGDPRTAADFV